jgi:hypothetical protein
MVATLLNINSRQLSRELTVSFLASSFFSFSTLSFGFLSPIPYRMHSSKPCTYSQLVCSLRIDLSPTLAIQLGLPFAPLFEGRGKIDLEDLSAQGLVQHDGSTCREDINSRFATETVSATQGKPSLRLVDLYWPPSDDPEAEYTWQNQAAILAHARRSSRSINGQFVLSPLQYVFSSGNVALQTTVIGGKLSDLRAWFGGSRYNRGVEGFEKGFEPKARQGWGVVSF